MRSKNWLRVAWVGVSVLAFFSTVSLSQLPSRSSASAADCSFLQNPLEFMYSAEKHSAEITELSASVSSRLRLSKMSVDRSRADASALTIPRHNLIDEAIFKRMADAGIQPAPLSEDQQFLRRVTLDLTGRIPTPDQVRAFAYDTNPGKRETLVDNLINSPEFVDKWTMFLGDLYRNNGPATNVNRFLQGRDAFYSYIRDAVAQNKPYNQIAAEIISANGDSFVDGATNFMVGGTVPMGPAQDTYDGQAVEVGRAFLGLNIVDCLLCHDGARHLDSVNLWGKDQTRMNFWGLSAFFARTRMQRVAVTSNATKTVVSELASGEYQLNTTTGNRTSRQPVNGVNRVAPKYPLGGQTVQGAASRRGSLAAIVTSDPQFSRAIVNYVWEKLMVEAFVTPSNAFDLARINPQTVPAAPWTLQPTNPELLEQLSQWFRDNNYNLRGLIALIVKSSAYQLDSDYPGEWKADYVPYYARHYVRRLDAEEVHDAIVVATGVRPNYTMDYDGSLQPLPAVSFAMQFPDTREPRSNNAVAQFLNAFGRGDRDQTPRTSDGSQLQALNMMNNAFVMGRIHQGNAGSNVQRLLQQTTDPLAIIESLYLSTVGRYPNSDEVRQATDVLKRLGTARGAESLQWALLNRLDFIYSY